MEIFRLSGKCAINNWFEIPGSQYMLGQVQALPGVGPALCLCALILFFPPMGLVLVAMMN